MATILPFKAFRPSKGKESLVAAPPYDVLNSQEAKALTKDNPYSFLHVDKAEIDIENLNDIYSPEVYKKASKNLNKMISDGILIQDEKPYLYIYRLETNGHSQTGIVCCTLVEEYLNGTIKKHELTRPEKEKDRAEHIKACSAHTGPIFMAYRKNSDINDIINEETKNTPEYDFTSNDNVRHTVWVIKDENTISLLENKFSTVPNLYIADGHHRNAAAADVYTEMKENGTVTEGVSQYLSVLFPDDELTILGYHRVVKDLNGLSENEFFEKISEKFYIMPYTKNGPFTPFMQGQFGMFYNNMWYILTPAEDTVPNDIVEGLDVSVIYNNLLSPVLGIKNMRTDRRISFCGGKDSISQLERLVITGQAKVAFALYPTSINQLFAVADENKIMPPKSTWFEPKLRSGLFIHKF